MKLSKIIARSFFLSILMFNYTKPSKPMPSPLYGKEGRNNKMKAIVEASMGLIDQLEREFREKRMLDQKKQPGLSAEQVENSVQFFLEKELNILEDQLLKINKELADK